MKKLPFILVLGITTCAYAQQVTVVKKDVKIMGETVDGYYTALDGRKETVAAAYNRLMKDFGRVKSGTDFQFVEGPALGGTVYTTGIIYGRTSGNDERASIWLGLKPAQWTVNDITIVQNQLEKTVYQFGIKFYKDQIQAQIDEGQQALDAVVRQQGRLTNQNKDLSIKLGNNEQEKVQLEKSLESNKLENLVLLQRIINNKKAQDSVALAGEQIKKVIEMHKDRQRKVN